MLESIKSDVEKQRVTIFVGNLDKNCLSTFKSRASLFCNYINQMDKVTSNANGLNVIDEEAQDVADAQFDSPIRVEEEEDYVVEDQFWDIEVIDNWEERIKRLQTPEQ